MALQKAKQKLERVDGALIRVAQKLQNQIPGLSRTIVDHFPGLFQDCLRFFTGLKI